MSETAQSAEKLLARVGSRQIVARFGRFFFWGTVSASILYLALLLTSRLLGVIPDHFQWWTAAFVPAAGLLVSLFALRRPAERVSARQIDLAMGTKDLFLTRTMAKSAGDGREDFSQIVDRQAREQAGKIKAPSVVPWPWEKRGAITLTLVLALLAGAFFLPQLDPFGEEKKRNLIGQRQEKLEALRKESQRRAEILKKVSADTRSPEVAKALAELEKTFQQAKPKKREDNLAKLQANQKELGKLWRKIDSEKLKNSMPGDAMKQGLGVMQSPETKAMREAVRNGDVKPVQKKLEEIKQKLADAEKKSDPAERRAAQQEARREVQELAGMLANELGSKNVSEALQRAMEQLDMSALEGLDKEAMEAAKESLGLSQKELEELAKAMKDQQTLEDALAALQNAKKLADMEKLDGGECEGCKGIGDYKKLYDEMVAGMGMGEGEGEGEGEGNGTGMKGKGTGEGGIAPEDEGLETGHKVAKAPSALQGGKMLMEWKTKGVSEPGDARIAFDESIRNLKEGVGEAIRSERIPPSYHGGIQKYFDTIEKAVDSPQPPPAE